MTTIINAISRLTYTVNALEVTTTFSSRTIPYNCNIGLSLLANFRQKTVSD